jgi:protein-ribulosamine 3-kinase
MNVSDVAIRTGVESLLKVSLLPAVHVVSGGNINQCLRYESSEQSYFVKVTSAAEFNRFEVEAAELQVLQQSSTIRVPQVINYGQHSEHALLILEWIDLQPASPQSDAILGEQLAQLHRITKPLFGWKHHNYIGSTPQINWWNKSWSNFWSDHRFEAQLNRAIDNNAPSDFIERAALLNTLTNGFLSSHQPVASLLHGDLWNGNRSMDTNGSPVIYDPALYFGDRECDFAMTKLFGGFHKEFYAAYEAAWPLESGWQQRVDLYNLYHVLNHFNLFGGEYLQQADRMVNRLLSELGR